MFSNEFVDTHEGGIAQVIVQKDGRDDVLRVCLRRVKPSIISRHLAIEQRS